MSRKSKVAAELAFTPPMECLAVKELPEGPDWTYEVKLDGYRAQAIHGRGVVRLLSRTGKDLVEQYPSILPALAIAVPSGAAVDGEIVALDENGYPSLPLLQNAATTRAPLVFFAFDLLALSGRDMSQLPHVQRRRMLSEFMRTSDEVQITESFDMPAPQMLDFVRKHGLEGVIAKRSECRYEAGLRTGAWSKLRLIMGQEFVIGGFTRGGRGFDSLLIGYYQAGRLQYCARVRNGFVPATRHAVHGRLWPLSMRNCPFVNLPEKVTDRLGQGLTAERMRDCIWVRPEVVGQFAFLEWTAGDHLRHVRFLGLRDDKSPRSVVRET